MNVIYTEHAALMNTVPATKVVKVTKTMLRKMRGNLLARGLPSGWVDDGYDWAAAIER